LKDVSIYVLVDPRDDLVRYVGKTSEKLETRLKSHMAGSRRGIRTHWFQ
jgi:hypothetical protein